MPSIKSCLATLAVMALAFAPINATATKAHGVSAAVARRAAAAAAIEKRATSPYSAKSAFLNTKAAVAAAKIRCGTDNVCVKRTAAAPVNGAAVCVSGKCTYRCDSGFAPGGTTGTDCVASQSTCAGVNCDVPDNGYATCDATTGACNVGCNAGFVRYSQQVDGSAPYFCFATSSDAANCGTPGNACPKSYNGIGTPACKSSTCKIQCPAGYFLRKAASTDTPYYCYNGQSSLVN